MRDLAERIIDGGFLLEDRPQRRRWRWALLAVPVLLGGTWVATRSPPPPPPAVPLDARLETLEAALHQAVRDGREEEAAEALDRAIRSLEETPR